MRKLSGKFRIDVNRTIANFNPATHKRPTLAQRRARKPFYSVLKREYVRTGYVQSGYVETYEQYLLRN